MKKLLIIAAIVFSLSLNSAALSYPGTKYEHRRVELIPYLERNYVFTAREGT